MCPKMHVGLQVKQSLVRSSVLRFMKIHSWFLNISHIQVGGSCDLNRHSAGMQMHQQKEKS
jgi:hypothetical protein